MNNCTNCEEGLISQGESIKTVCGICGGTGVIAGEVSEPEMEATNVPPAEESFLEESGEELAVDPESEEEVPATDAPSGEVE